MKTCYITLDIIQITHSTIFYPNKLNAAIVYGLGLITLNFLVCMMTEILLIGCFLRHIIQICYILMFRLSSVLYWFHFHFFIVKLMRYVITLINLLCTYVLNKISVCRNVALKECFYRTDVDYQCYEHNVNFSLSLSMINDSVYRKFGDVCDMWCFSKFYFLHGMLRFINLVFIPSVSVSVLYCLSLWRINVQFIIKVWKQQRHKQEHTGLFTNSCFKDFLTRRHYPEINYPNTKIITIIIR